MDDASKNLKGPSWSNPDTISFTICVPGLSVAIVFGSSSAPLLCPNPQYPYTLPSSSTNTAGSKVSTPSVFLGSVLLQLHTLKGPSGLSLFATMPLRPPPWLLG